MSSPLDTWRQELRSLIPRGFLRRDQGNCLFVSDYPRLGNEAAHGLRDAGYIVEIHGGLAYIDGSPDKYCALAAALPDVRIRPDEAYFWLYSLAAHLQKSGADLTADNLPLVRLTLKKLDEGDLAGLQRLLPSAAAECQRKHILLPKAAGQLILGVFERRKGEI